MSPRNLLDAVPTVTRILLNFYMKQLVLSNGGSRSHTSFLGSRLVALLLMNIVLAFSNFLLDCNYPVGGGV